MAESCVHVVLFLLVSSLPISIASPHKLRLSASDVAALEAHAPPPPDPPTTVFEVDRPHRPPPGSIGPCSTMLLSHSFAFTYTKPPVTAAYSPPPCLAAAGGRASVISLAVLEWRATCRGVQYDRIFGVWLGGVELLRSCTAEPLPNGIVWSVSKDITKYASLLASRNSTTLAVYLGNLVDDRYTGVYHANLTLHLYFRHQPQPPQPGLGPADVIVPISQSLPLNDGLWFQIHNNQDVGSASLTVPTNVYRAVLEVYLSYHSDDEFWFWYMNTPGGHGPFREVTVRIDGDIVGAVWPFPVIYTGAFNPFLWRPISGIGSFNLPSYDIELTPFLGKLLDGQAHEFDLAVTNAQNVWFVDANLHLWLDPRSAATTAGIISYDAPPLEQTIWPDGPGKQFYHTTAFRHISAAGWVQTSSYGKITATWTQRFSYENTNEIQDGSERVINQTTYAYSGVHVADHAGVVYSQEAQQSFPLYIFAGVVNQTVQTSNDSYTVAWNVQLGFGEERVAAGRLGFWSQSLSNAQDCAVNTDVEGGNTVGMSWGTKQTYRYEAADGCYFRDVTSSGYRIVSDHSHEVCVRGGSSSARAGPGGAAALATAAGVGRLSS